MEHAAINVAAEPKGWLRIERGVKTAAAFNAIIRAQLALPKGGKRLSLRDNEVSGGQPSGRTDDGNENNALDGENPVEIEAVHPPPITLPLILQPFD